MFIAVAGIDGSGKSTLVKFLAGALALEGHSVRVTYEPGGTNLGREIRKLLLTAAQNHHETVGRDWHEGAEYDTDSAWFAEQPEPLAELLLFAAARAQHCARIRDWLQAGETVITDRFSLCTLAYQGARGLSESVIQPIEEVSTGGLRPDVTLLLDVPVDLARGRLYWGRRNMDRFEAESEAYFERVRSIYLRHAHYDPNIYVIDATQSVDDVVAQAVEIVLRHQAEHPGVEMSIAQTPKEDIVLRTYAGFKQSGKVIVPKDIAEATPHYGGKVGVITVRKTLRKYNLWDEQAVADMSKERWDRINAKKRENGMRSLQNQAAQGYPNLAKARATLAQRKAEQQARVAGEA